MKFQHTEKVDILLILLRLASTIELKLFFPNIADLIKDRHSDILLSSLFCDDDTVKQLHWTRVALGRVVGQNRSSPKL